jgi:hypothetical protein
MNVAALIERHLEAGAGSGYLAHLMGRCCAEDSRGDIRAIQGVPDRRLQSRSSRLPRRIVMGSDEQRHHASALVVELMPSMIARIKGSLRQSISHQ